VKYRGKAHGLARGTGSTQNSTRDVQSVLFLCLAGVGDSLLATAAIGALKRCLPHARVTVLTMLGGARKVMERCPHADDVLHFDFQREGLLRSLRYVLELRRRRFDVSILTYPANRIEYNMISFLIGATARLGHRYNHLDRVCGNWLNTHGIREDDGLSNIEENLRLAECVIGAKMPNAGVTLTRESGWGAFGTKWLSENDLQGKKVIGFHPGCDTRKNHINRRWPPDSFAALGRILVEEAEAAILVFGGSEEEELKEHIASAIGPSATAVKAMDLPDTCALIAACGHFVSNDSGLMHLASALGVSTTAIFGPTNPVWLRNPSAPRNEILMGLPCQPCFYYSPRHLRCRHGDFRCVRNLPPERVAAVVLSTLASSRFHHLATKRSSTRE